MEKITQSEDGSSPVWEEMERYTREAVQRYVQDLLEEEGEELLGRRKSERRQGDSRPGYRNGDGKARRLTLLNGTITVKRPRVRDLDERFESRVLPLFRRRTKEVGQLLPELYLHGLAHGDFELALRGFLGEGAPLSVAWTVFASRVGIAMETARLGTGVSTTPERCRASIACHLAAGALMLITVMGVRDRIARPERRSR